MPLVCAMFGKLGFAKAVNQLVPYQGDVDLGSLVEVMVLNRLLQLGILPISLRTFKSRCGM